VERRFNLSLGAAPGVDLCDSYEIYLSVAASWGNSTRGRVEIERILLAVVYTRPLIAGACCERDSTDTQSSD